MEDPCHCAEISCPPPSSGHSAYRLPSPSHAFPPLAEQRQEISHTYWWHTGLTTSKRLSEPVWSAFTFTCTCTIFYVYVLDNYWPIIILSNVKSNPLPYASGACPVDTLQPLGPARHAGHLGALGWGPSCCVRSQERGRVQGWALGWAPETGQHLVRDQHGTSQLVAHWGSTSISWEYGWKRRKAWTNFKWRILTIVQNTKHYLASQITALYIYYTKKISKIIKSASQIYFMKKMVCLKPL